MGQPLSNILPLWNEDIATWSDLSHDVHRFDASWSDNATASNDWSFVEEPTTPNGPTVLKQNRANNTSASAGRCGPSVPLDCVLWGTEAGETTGPIPGYPAARTRDEIVWFRRGISWTKQASGAAWTTGMITLLHLKDGSTEFCRIGICSATGAIGYFLGTGTFTPVTSGTSLATGTFSAGITARYRKSSGASDGILQIWLGDTLIVNVSNHNTTNTLSGSAGGFMWDVQFFGLANAAHFGADTNIYTRYAGNISPTHFAEIFNSTPSQVWAVTDQPWSGLGIGSLRTTSANVCSCQEPGAFRHAWAALSAFEVAIEYSTASDFSGSTTTSYATATAANMWWVNIPLTGLTLNTEYYYRTKNRDPAVPGTVENGPTRTLRTRGGAERVGLVHCTDQAGGPYMFAHTWVQTGVRFAWHLGDYIYNDSSYSPTGPHSRKADLLREYKMPLHDILMLRYLHQGHQDNLASDHDNMEDGMNNEVLGSYMQGYIDIGGVNPTGANGEAYENNDLCQNSFLRGDDGARQAVERTITAISTHSGGISTVTTSEDHGYGAGDTVTLASTNSTPSANGAHTIVATPTSTTFTISLSVTVAGTTGTATAPNRIRIRELSDNGRQAFHTAFRSGQPGLVRFGDPNQSYDAWRDTEDFESYSLGSTYHVIRLGSREWQDWIGSPGYPEPFNTTGQPCMMGTIFQDWLELQCQAIASTTKLVVIVQDSTFGAHNSVDDNYQDVSKFQRNAILAILQANLPAGCKVAFLGGDRHWQEFDDGNRFVDGVLPGLTSGLDYSDRVLCEVCAGQGSKGILGQGETLAEIADPTGILLSQGGDVSRSPVAWARFGCILDIDPATPSISAEFYAYPSETDLNPEPDIIYIAADSDTRSPAALREHPSRSARHRGYADRY